MATVSRNIIAVVIAVVMSLGSVQASNVTYQMGCPIVLNGTCPDDEYISFHLFTRTNPMTAELVDLVEDNLLSTNFNPAHPTKIIIHGFNDNFTDDTLLAITTQYLMRDEYNVIMVDWSNLAIGQVMPCYLSAAGNLPHVGACVAGLIERLREEAAQDIHVIGHSLGAHMANYVADNLKPYILPRITGLDPAGPLFETAGNDWRLDSTDADYVDILHTNVYASGIAADTGHVDFYFNGGTNQPDCGIMDQLCSHLRANLIFAESINSEEGFWGWQCSNFPLYYASFCWPKPRDVLAGDNVNQNSSRGVIAVPTADTFPFAAGRPAFRKRNVIEWKFNWK